MASSYGKLANLPDEDEQPKKGYARLASLSDDPAATTTATPTAEAPAADRPYSLTEDFKSLGKLETWKRTAGLMFRSVIEGVEGLPVMAMDLGVGTRNLLTGENYPLPSEMNREAMDQVFPKPESKLEKVMGFAQSAMVGAKIPAPQIANPAPTGFVRPDANPMSALLRESQQAGYVVPPTSASASMGAKVAETLAGKAATAQAASIRNQEVTNELVRKALGMKEGAAITPQSLASLRETAGKVYAQIADAGEIVPDTKFVDDLAQLGKSADEISGAFPGANVGATKQIGELVDSLLQNKFDSKAALQYLRELRKMASGNLTGVNAADPAKQALGMAQREAASTLEELIGRHLERSGMKDVAQSFGMARKLIAMTHSVENALNETTGNVIATKLGQQMAKGKPLSGELEIAARFARAFPKAAKEVTESMPGASPLDWATGAIVSGSTGNPAGLLLAGVRPTARALALSPMAQGALSRSATPYLPPGVLGLAPSAAIQLEGQ